MKNRPANVCILVANLPAERDRRVIRESLALEAAGYDVTIIAPRGDASLKVLPGSRGTRLRPFPVVVQGSGLMSFAFEFGWSMFWITVRLTGEILRGRAQAVQVCNPPDVYWPIALLYRRLRRPWVLDHHDLCPEIYATRTGTPNRWIYRTLAMLEWLTLRTATWVIATNESFRQNAVDRGVAPEKISVVRNGPAANEIAPELGAQWDAVHTIVYIGVFGPQDNVAGAVLAAKELVTIRGRADWRLVLAGDGETMPELTKLVAEHGLADIVEFTGWLDTVKVDALLRQAAVAIQPDLPSRMNHLSTMAKTVEYLGRGVPVVAVDLVETRRSAADAAVYVPQGTPREFAEALNRLLDDPAERERMSTAGRRRFDDELAWEHQARHYVAVWRRLLPIRSRREPK